MDEQDSDVATRRPLDLSLLADFQRSLSEVARGYAAEGTLDIAFLVFLRTFSRYGYFVFGPITIDVEIVQRLVEQTVVRGVVSPPGSQAYADDYVRFTRHLMDEARGSGRGRLEPRHFLLAFMRCGEGIPARVFGELGVPREAVAGVDAPPPSDAGPGRLYSTDQAASYLGVHPQTVRSWIRSGKLRAHRVGGQRTLRLRQDDLDRLLEPLDVDRA